MQSLYHTVKKIYAPLLLGDTMHSGTFGPMLQELLSSLEAGLGRALRLDSTSENGLGAIVSPSDEFQYWAECAMSGSQLLDRERAASFQAIFQDVASDFLVIDGLDLNGLLELVEKVQDTLDDGMLPLVLTALFFYTPLSCWRATEGCRITTACSCTPRPE